MLSHSAIWDAIDSLATRHGFTPSGLAKLAGLDPTAFNRSKRVSRDGRERWPSTESIAKLLEATGESFDSFLSAGGAYLQTASQNVIGATVAISTSTAPWPRRASSMRRGSRWAKAGTR